MRNRTNRTGRTRAAAAGLAIVLAGGLHGGFHGRLNAGEAHDPMLVVLRSTAPVQGAFVQLRDVADLPNDPHRIRQYVGEILLGFSPGSGAVREIRAEEVAVRLREAGIPEELFSVKGAERISVFLLDDGAAASSRIDALPDEDDRAGGLGSAAARRAAAARSEAPPAARREAPRESPRPAPLDTKRAAPAPARTESAARPGRESAKLTTARTARDVAAASGAGTENGSLEKGEIMVLRTTGQALFLEEPVRVVGSGPSPDVIEVQNIRTGKRCLARVVDRGVVVRAEAASAPAGPTYREGGE